MFRSVRNKKNEIGLEAAKELLCSSRRGVLSVIGENNYPYAIPINYLYDQINNKIIFHGSKVGYKVDALKENNKVCFTVFGNEKIKEEKWAPYLQSVVIFGRCHLVENTAEVICLVKQFANKYYPNEALIDVEIETSKNAVQIFQIAIEHMTGKEVQER